MNLEKEDFNKIFATRSHGVSLRNNEQYDLNAFVDSIPNSLELLERYEGYYYSHFHAMGYPGYLVRSLLRVYRYENQFYTKSIEHLWDKETGTSTRHRFKYRGLMLYLADRMFLTEYETLNNQAVCHTILYPSYRSSIDYLSGVTTGVGSFSAHLPKAARVVFQFLGKSIDIKPALKGCGLFKIDSPVVSDEIRSSIENDISDDEFMLTARGQ